MRGEAGPPWAGLICATPVLCAGARPVGLDCNMFDIWIWDLRLYGTTGGRLSVR
ncbi:MAG: hypothetical protein ACLP1E_11240 [Acidimicrobiales bacterium]